VSARYAFALSLSLAMCLAVSVSHSLVHSSMHYPCTSGRGCMMEEPNDAGATFPSGGATSTVPGTTDPTVKIRLGGEIDHVLRRRIVRLAAPITLMGAWVPGCLGVRVLRVRVRDMNGSFACSAIKCKLILLSKWGNAYK
jgi:hypothetical protein